MKAAGLLKTKGVSTTDYVGRSGVPELKADIQVLRSTDCVTAGY